MGGGQFIHQLRLFQGHGAQDHPIQPAAQQFRCPFSRAHPSAQLHRDGKGTGDRLHRPIVHRFTTFCPIQVDQMQALGSLLLPSQGLGHGVIGKAGHLAVVALVQPHAVPVQQVDGGDDLHGTGQLLPARLPEAPLPQLHHRHHEPEAAIENGF